MALQGNVTFDVNKAVIKPQFYPILDRLAKVFMEHEKTLIEIAGHTDNTGTDEINIPLSKSRAKSVSDYLVNQGVKRLRMAELGLGSAHPIVANDTPENRQLNRRVEITLVPIT